MKECTALLQLYQNGPGTIPQLLGILQFFLINSTPFIIKDINEVELKAFQTLARVPVHVPDDIDALLFLFSYEARERKSDCTLGNIKI